MPLTTKPYDRIVSDQVASMQANNPNMQFPEGSVLLSIVESNAGVALWMQGIVSQVAALTRASSSTGSDLDSFYAQFNFPRNLAQFASGQVVFSRITATNQATVPVTSAVQTSAGDIQFYVYPDPTNINFNPSLNAYVLAPSVVDISVPVIAFLAGTSGNVSAGAINQISSNIPGIDSVNNPDAFTNGADQESDNDYRQRFIPYINSLSLATLLAYQTAITNGTPSIFYNIAENTNNIGNPQLGLNTIIIDDGSGSPPSSLINSVYQKLNMTRALGIQIGVYAVTVLTVNIAVTVSLNPLYDQPTLLTQIKNGLSAYFASLQIAQSVIFTQIYQVIYNSSVGVIEATGLLLNSATSDIACGFNQRAYVGAVNIIVS